MIIITASRCCRAVAIREGGSRRFTAVGAYCITAHRAVTTTIRRHSSASATIDSHLRVRLVHLNLRRYLLDLLDLMFELCHHSFHGFLLLRDG